MNATTTNLLSPRDTNIECLLLYLSPLRNHFPFEETGKA